MEKETFGLRMPIEAKEIIAELALADNRSPANWVEDLVIKKLRELGHKV